VDRQGSHNAGTEGSSPGHVLLNNPLVHLYLARAVRLRPRSGSSGNGFDSQAILPLKISKGLRGVNTSTRALGGTLQTMIGEMDIPA
jgi:hypothetical protein